MEEVINFASIDGAIGVAVWLTDVGFSVQIAVGSATGQVAVIRNTVAVTIKFAGIWNPVGVTVEGAIIQIA